MKKMYILVFIFFILILSISIVGSSIVSGDNRIKTYKDIFTIQSNKEVYFDGYGYSIDNPNLIVNPYGNSPLTAIIMFDTNNYSEVSITIKGKDDNSDINYTFSSNKHHLIPIYGLYADYDNTVIIRSENKEKVINIKTDALPLDFKFVNDIGSDTFSFYNGNYPYAVDINNDVRWYLNSNYYGNITFLSDSKIIIGNDKYNEDGTTTGIYEMNLLGKIYNEYLLSNSYYGYSTLYKDNILVLSDKVVCFDSQTGEVIDELFDNDNYDYIDIYDDSIIVHNEGGFYKYFDGKFDSIDYVYNITSFNLYNDTNNYKIVPPKRYGILNKTKTSDKRISLIRYDERDLKDIDISMDNERITVTSSSSDKVYIIFDKLFDKKIYEVSGTKYINNTSFNGKYTIYYSINDKVYKTNYYIEV